jgi:Interleukin-like EMT inducer
MVTTASWGWNWGGSNSWDAGYIAIDGNTVYVTSYEMTGGFHIVELNVTSCSSSNIRHFNTYSSAAESDNMMNYINSLPMNTVLIGITSCDARQYLSSRTKAALLAIGVYVYGLEFLDRASFVAQIGQPGTSVSEMGPPGVGISMINVTGTLYIQLILSNQSVFECVDVSHVFGKVQTALYLDCVC